MQGKIIKGIAGFYYVHPSSEDEAGAERERDCARGCSGGDVYECKAKGILRKDKTKPLVGDDVEFVVLDGAQRTGHIQAVLPRRNALIRPAVANVDQALIIFAVTKPEPNFNLLDRFLIRMRQQSIPCVICFNKSDLDGGDCAREYAEIYRGSGCRTITVSAETGDGIEELRLLLRGRTTAVAGPSGVGKSSLVNVLQDAVRMETGSISAKIERGRHTTRHSELIAVSSDTYILDTPGFSSMDLFELEKEQLADCYPEFAEHEAACKFRGCAHIDEPVCGVKEAVAGGAISGVRYENYRQLYEELKNRRRYS